MNHLQYFIIKEDVDKIQALLHKKRVKAHEHEIYKIMFQNISISITSW